MSFLSNSMQKNICTCTAHDHENDLLSVYDIFEWLYNTDECLLADVHFKSLNHDAGSNQSQQATWNSWMRHLHCFRSHYTGKLPCDHSWNITGFDSEREASALSKPNAFLKSTVYSSLQPVIADLVLVWLFQCGVTLHVIGQWDEEDWSVSHWLVCQPLVPPHWLFTALLF